MSGLGCCHFAKINSTTSIPHDVPNLKEKCRNLCTLHLAFWYARLDQAWTWCVAARQKNAKQLGCSYFALKLEFRSLCSARVPPLKTAKILGTFYLRLSNNDQTRRRQDVQVRITEGMAFS